MRKAVEHGSYFFSQAVRLGEMMYQAVGAEKMLVPPWIIVNATEVLLRMEKRWYAWFDLARRSLTTAQGCIDRGEHVLGVCQLGHAAEFTCVALVRAATGYRPQTHNLHKLLELATGVSLSMAVVFPGITKEEDALLDTLQHAQAYTRFKEGFTVPAETAQILADRVADLQDTALRIYSELMNEKVAAFEKPDEDLVAGEQDLYLNHERYERKTTNV